MTKAEKIIKLSAEGKTVNEVSRMLKVGKNYVYYVRWKHMKSKAKETAERNAPLIGKRWFEGTADVPPKVEAVNHPPHYKAGGVETIDFIEAKDLNYRLGNCVKYISRAGRKIGSDPVEDLEKALWYLKREIDVRKEA
jgi:hypothetical protein